MRHTRRRTFPLPLPITTKRTRLTLPISCTSPTRQVGSFFFASFVAPQEATLAGVRLQLGMGEVLCGAGLEEQQCGPVCY